MSDDPANIAQFIELTGADEATAKSTLEAAKGDMDAALALHFDVGGGGDDDEDAVMAEPAPSTAPPALPSESTADLVGGILKNARQEGEGEPAGGSNAWAGRGHTLGSAAADDAVADDEAAGASSSSSEPPPLGPADRSNAKKVRVIFWEDGFTVEDVTAEEAAAAAAAKAPPAPRRTGLATLSSESARSGGGPPMPKLPELRKYEDNAEFIRDLQASIPPREFREVDLSSGQPRPRPVDIMLGDMRPQAYPAELVKRHQAMQGMQSQKLQPDPKKSSFAAFSGAGQTLGGGGGSEGGGASESAASATESPPVMRGGAAAAAGGGAWPERTAPTVDDATATTIQVRLASGGPQRFKLNKAHTVGDLKALVEAALSATGESARPYTLAAGFPPKPLADEAATIEAAGLVGAAVTQRWS